MEKCNRGPSQSSQGPVPTGAVGRVGGVSPERGLQPWSGEPLQGWPSQQVLLSSCGSCVGHLRLAEGDGQLQVLLLLLPQPLQPLALHPLALTLGPLQLLSLVAQLQRRATVRTLSAPPGGPRGGGGSASTPDRGGRRPPSRSACQRHHPPCTQTLKSSPETCSVCGETACMDHTAFTDCFYLSLLNVFINIWPTTADIWSSSGPPVKVLSQPLLMSLTCRPVQLQRPSLLLRLQQHQMSRADVLMLVDHPQEP